MAVCAGESQPVRHSLTRLEQTSQMQSLPDLRIADSAPASIQLMENPNLLKRKRGKHGPEARISVMEESDITQAMRTSSSRSGEPVFLPAVGMEFDSAKEAKDFCNLYSWEIGFGIRKGRNRVNDNNYTTRQNFVCSCEGLCPNSRAATCRTGCKAMIRLHRTSDHGWVISRFHPQHNHPCSATHGQNKQWLSHSDIDPMTKDVVRKLRENREGLQHSRGSRYSISNSYKERGDQCQAMAAAIKTTLKATNHWWCQWHVLRKTKQKVGPTYSKKRNFKKEFNKLVTEETMRSAPMHMFVRKFNEFQMDRNDHEEKEVYLTKQMHRKHRVGVPIERHAELIYTRRIYEKFYNELYYAGGYAIKSRTSDGVFEVAHSLFDGNADQIFYKVVYVGGEKITCQCGLYEHLVLVHLDVKEIPKNNIMPRWMKDGDESADHSNVKTGFHVIRGSSDVLKKRALVSRVLEVAYGPNAISEEVYAQAMGVMDLVRSQSSMLQPLVDQPSHDPRISVVTSASAISAPTNIRCPDRPTKKGRPANSSLQSWKEEQKRNNRQSTDEENPRGDKTRLIADVLAV
ncbi:unnamed protein product [Miscanthus lutarioriparius]|uniref:FAR1 domain-containing protein n=1 Tax=Miscanthus lutarioriparius TaxID=422564 RepID=A0A811QDB0_9POAL|nr:unnamed protein product [Miscanthus lutarioriparius]